LRIGIDVRMLGYSGIGTYIEGLIKGLTKIDRKNQYFLITNREESGSFPPNFEIKRINARIFSVQEQWELYSLIEKEKLDIFHFPHFFSLFFCPCKMVVTIHDLIPLIFPNEFSIAARLYCRLMISHSLKKSKKIIAVSQNTKKDILNFFHTPEEKIEVIYEGVDEDFHPVTDRHLLSEIKSKYHIDAPFILYAGLRKPHKNLVSLIEAFRIFKKSGSKEKLVIAGKEDRRYPLEQEIKKMGISQEVILTGHVSRQDLVLLYNAADIFIFPSLYEGFGLPVLEAMACGRPVIASNRSSIPEIAGDGAIFFDPYNVEEMARAIETVLNNESLRCSLVEKALKKAGAFSWIETSKRTLRVYEEIQKTNENSAGQ